MFSSLPWGNENLVFLYLQIAGILDAAFARLADLIIKSVMIPLTHASAIHIVSEELVKNKPYLSWDLLSDAQVSVET